MNGSQGITPTIELASANNNGYGYGFPVMPVIGNYGYGNNNGFFGGEGIWAIVLIALLFGNNGFGGGFGGNGWNNIATTDYISSEFTQRDINNGFQNTNNLISNGFSNTAQDVCNLRSEVLENRYASALGDSNTQRDVLMQTTQIQSQLSNLALSNQAALDKCCCDIERLIREDGDETRALITANTIQDLRDKLAAANDVISDERTTNNVINSLRPYPIPAYLTASPYSGIGFFNNGFGWGNNGFYGNGFFGNTIV